MPSLRLLAPAAVLALAAAFAAPASAQSFSAPQREEIGKVVRDYLLTNPELLEEVMVELQKRQQAQEAERHAAAVKTHSNLIFNSPRNVVIGNPNGDVSFVEFFDYNCGYCKKALEDMTHLMKSDPKLRIVLKEFPVLGPGSEEAAKVAVAVRMQDNGKKYLDFHTRLLTGRGEANKARAIAAAKEAGFDIARIEKDLTSPEIMASLEESMTLARALGLNGTPSYVIGPNVVVGAVGVEGLSQKINLARCGKASC